MTIPPMCQVTAPVTSEASIYQPRLTDADSKFQVEIPGRIHPLLCGIPSLKRTVCTWNTRLFQDEFQFGKASYQMPCESFGECMGKVLFWNEDERNLELRNWNSKNKCEEYNTLKTLKWKVKTYTVYPIFGSFFVDSQQNHMFKWKSLNDLKDHLSQHHRHVTTPQLPPDQKPFSIFSRPLPAFPGTQRAGFFVGGSQDWW